MNFEREGEKKYKHTTNTAKAANGFGFIMTRYRLIIERSVRRYRDAFKVFYIR